MIMLQEAPDIFQFIQDLIVKVGYEVWNYLLTYQMNACSTFIIIFRFMCVIKPLNFGMIIDALSTELPSNWP